MRESTSGTDNGKGTNMKHEIQDAPQKRDKDFLLLIDNQCDLICCWRPDTTLTFVNRSYCTFYGRSRDQLIGQKWITLIPVDQRPAVARYHKDLIENPGEHRYVHQAVAADGRRIWQEWIGAPIVDDQGSIVEFQSIGRDITAAKEAELKLKQSERLLRESQQIAHIGTFEVGLSDYHTYYWSDEMYRIFETQKEKGIPTYQAFLEMIYPEDRENVDRFFQHTVRKRHEYEITHRLLLKEEKVKYVHAVGRTEFDRSGNPARSMGTVQDVTESMRLQEDLKTSQAVLQTFFDAIPERAMLIEPDGKVIIVNEFMAKKLGSSKEALINANIFDFLPLKLGNQLSLFGLEVVRTGKPVQFEDEHDGEILDNRLYPVADNERNVTRLAIISIDITQRRNMEIELERQLEKFNKLLSTTSEGYWLVNADGRLIDVNRQACSMSGYTRDEMLQMGVSDLEAQETTEQVQGHIKAILKDGYGLFETQHRTKDGRIIDVEIRATIWHTGEDIVVFAFLRDITNAKKHAEHQKAREITLAADRARHAFLSHVSHGLKTPLNAILGMSQLLARDPSLREAGRRQAETIRQSGERLIRVFDDLLSFARMESSLAALNSETFDPIDLLKEVSDMFRAQCESRGLGMTVDIDLSMPRSVNADRQKLKRILVNLLENAVKVTHTEGVALRAWAESAANAAREGETLMRVIVEVMDGGPWVLMESEEGPFYPLGRVLEREKKADNELELLMSWEYARMMKGAIQVRRLPAKGNCFRLTVVVDALEEPCMESGEGPRGVIKERAAGDFSLSRSAAHMARVVESLPAELKFELRDALEDGDMARFAKQLVPLEASEPEVARGLYRLTESFDYETLRRLLTNGKAEGNK